MACMFGHKLKIESRVGNPTGFIRCRKCDNWWSSETGNAYASINGMLQPGGGHKDLSKKDVEKCWYDFNYQHFIDKSDYSSLIKVIDDNKIQDDTNRAVLALIKMPNSPLVTTSLVSKWLFFENLMTIGNPLGLVAITMLAQKYASEELIPVFAKYVEQQFYNNRIGNQVKAAENIYKALQALAANGSKQAKEILMDGVRKAQGDGRIMAINAAFVVDWFPELTEAILDAVKDLIDKKWWKTDALNHYKINPRGMGSPDRNSIVNVIQTVDKHNGNNDVEQRYMRIFEEINQSN